MLSATCHCSAVRVEIPRRPRSLTNCNCSLSRRYGTLWAYYPATQVRVTGATSDYAWGDRRLRFVRCGSCGCITHWEHIVPTASARVGVNARNFDPAVLGPVRIRLLDGADSWKYLG